MGGLRQATLRRTRGRAGLSQPVHAPRRHFQRAPDQRRWPYRRLPLERLPHQIRRPAKGHAVGHARVHSPLPDPRSARWLPPHPALRAARKRDPQSQHHQDPCLALRPAARTGRRAGTTDRDRPAHPARTVPLLRRPHAHNRDLPARAKTDVARATEGAGRMTYRPPSTTDYHWLQSVDTVRTACARSSPARHEAAITPKRKALLRSSAGFATVSGTWSAISRILDAAVAPIGRALSP